MENKSWIFLALGVLISGCTAQSKIRRAERLIKSAEELGAKWSVDTVYQTIEVITPKVEFDTVLTQVNFTDTLVVEKDKVVTRVKINTVTKEVYVSTKCPEKTIIKKIPVAVNKTITVGDRWYKKVFYGLIGAFLMFVFFIVGRAAKWIV